MSKIIRLTSTEIEKMKAEFAEQVDEGKLLNGKFTFTRSFNDLKRKAKLHFSNDAYLKMTTLVREFDKEVAWHGIARRDADIEKDEYYVDDIEVYPQTVTGVTVTTDQDEYQSWLFNHEDEDFANIRLQGHSHVNMGTTPSSVDTDLYEKILFQLEDDMFYIFLIWNKKQEHTVSIYDMKKNVLFEDKDISIDVIDDGDGFAEFLRNAREMVKDEPVKTIKTLSSSYKYNTNSTKANDAWDSYDDYYSGYYGTYYGSDSTYDPKPKKTFGYTHTKNKKKRKTV